ncbi:MAG: HAD family hydrolase [Methylophilaceae bacterium]|nr:HAD family hydrolase [Methylophilaceae bacterium]
MPIDGLLLDLDDTLLDERSATRTALLAFLAAHLSSWEGESEAEALQRWRLISATHWFRYENGEISFHEQRRARIRDFLALPLSAIEADIAFESYLTAYESSWSMVPECLAFLGKTAEIPKVIITNGDKAQQLNKIQMTGLREHVVGVVTPEDCGYWKPHPETFHAALALLRLKPEQCLMIGDDWVRDIQPAMQLGIRCFQVELGNPDKSLLSAIATGELSSELPSVNAICSLEIRQ